MNTQSSNNGVTRRSFIKRSVVAAVAVSTLSIFSGLVNAADPAGYTVPTGTCKSGDKDKCCKDKFSGTDNAYTCTDYPGYYCDKNGNSATQGTCPADPPKPK
jgi:hypothetical protein